METREAQVEEMDTQPEQRGAKLDTLVVEAQEAGTDAKSDYRERIDDLKSRYRLAQSKLDELRAAGSEKWETLKAGGEGAWNELEAALKKLTN